MAHISDFWRLGGVLSAELWQGRHSTDEGVAAGGSRPKPYQNHTALRSHSTDEGAAAGGRHSTDEGADEGRSTDEGHSTHTNRQDATLPHEDMDMGRWLRLSEDDMRNALRKWLSATRTIRLARRD